MQVATVGIEVTPSDGVVASTPLVCMLALACRAPWLRERFVASVVAVVVALGVGASSLSQLLRVGLVAAASDQQF